MEETKGQYLDFIGIYNGAFSGNFCEQIISTFDYVHQNESYVWCEDNQFSNSNAGRFDYAVDLNLLSSKIEGAPERELNQILVHCLEDYIHNHGSLKDNSFYSITQKVQKTPAGGGYHVWHYENDNLEYASRSMVWMVYLNDDFDGGETEFLYFKRRIKPKQGTLIIWPAGYTHTHRGGLVLDGTKYVITGWFHLGK